MIEPRDKERIRELVLDEIDFLDLKDEKVEESLIPDFDWDDLTALVHNLGMALHREYPNRFGVTFPQEDIVTRIKTVDQLADLLCELVAECIKDSS